MKGRGQREVLLLEEVLSSLYLHPVCPLLSVQSGLGVFLADGTGFSDFAYQVPYKRGLSYLSKCFLPSQLSK